MSLERRTPLGRGGKPLKRTELKRSGDGLARGAGPRRPELARGTKRLRARPKPVDERAANTAAREAVFARDGRRCQLDGVPGAGPCFGRLTFQHRRKDGQGGAYDLANGCTLCAGHNDGLEADADLANLCRRRGLVLRPWQDPAATPYLQRHEHTPEDT